MHIKQQELPLSAVRKVPQSDVIMWLCGEKILKGRYTHEQTVFSHKNY